MQNLQDLHGMCLKILYPASKIVRYNHINNNSLLTHSFVHFSNFWKDSLIIGASIQLLWLIGTVLDNTCRANIYGEMTRVLQNRITSIRIWLLFSFDADPPSTFLFWFGSGSVFFLMRIQIFINWCESSMLANRAFTAPLWASTALPWVFTVEVSLHSSQPFNLTRIRIRLLSLVRIWIWIFTRMRMRIQLPKMMRFDGDLYTEHWWYLTSLSDSKDLLGALHGFIMSLHGFIGNLHDFTGIFQGFSVSLPGFIAAISTAQVPAFHSDADPVFNFIRIGNTG